MRRHNRFRRPENYCSNPLTVDPNLQPDGKSFSLIIPLENTVSQRLRLALPSIEGAAEALMAEHKALGAAKREDYGTFIRDSAYNYAATYPF